MYTTTTFKSPKKDRHAIICLREDGAVDHAFSSYIMMYGTEGNPQLPYIIDNVLEILLADDVEEFKKLIRFLKGKNPQLYKRGKEMLEEMREYHEKEVEKYTL